MLASTSEISHSKDFEPPTGVLLNHTEATISRGIHPLPWSSTEYLGKQSTVVDAKNQAVIIYTSAAKAEQCAEWINDSFYDESSSFAI